MVQLLYMNNLKKEAIKLRQQGKTYKEIKEIIDKNISKSTLSCWCRNIKLSEKQKRRIESITKNNLGKSRKNALAANKKKRGNYLKSIEERVLYFKGILRDKDVAKISLAMLYLGEGSKTHKASLMFGNSNPEIVKLFLDLLRYCYNINEEKFRCTVQCRADQDVKKLEDFWSESTKIPKKKFYGARIDSRTIGKKTKKINYKGVCRIDYFSADIFLELEKIAEVLFKAGL